MKFRSKLKSILSSVYNESGCIDKTAYEALKNVRREERRALIELLKLTAEKHGYEITSRIDLKEIKEVDFDI